jgi:hypothetical protein
MNVSPAREKSLAAHACSRVSGRHFSVSACPMTLSSSDHFVFDCEDMLAQIFVKIKRKLSKTVRPQLLVENVAQASRLQTRCLRYATRK